MRERKYEHRHLALMALPDCDPPTIALPWNYDSFLLRGFLPAGFAERLFFVLLFVPAGFANSARTEVAVFGRDGRRERVDVTAVSFSSSLRGAFFKSSTVIRAAFLQSRSRS